MKQVAIGVVIAIALAGCGQTPTAPSPPPVLDTTSASSAPAQNVGQGSNSPTDPEEDPTAPSNPPEQPTDPKPPNDPKTPDVPKDPDPQPPTPPSDTRWATLMSAHWYADANPLPDSFKVMMSAGLITFGPCPTTPILIETPTSIFAKPCGANVQIVDQTWTYSGAQGLAGGTIR